MAAPPKAATAQEAAIVTLMGLGLSSEEARSFVCAAMAEDKSGCLAAPVIARRAYQLCLSKPEDKEPAASPLSGLRGYESIKEAGLIENEMP